MSSKKLSKNSCPNTLYIRIHWQMLFYTYLKEISTIVLYPSKYGQLKKKEARMASFFKYFYCIYSDFSDLPDKQVNTLIYLH